MAQNKEKNRGRAQGTGCEFLSENGLKIDPKKTAKNGRKMSFEAQNDENHEKSENRSKKSKPNVQLFDDGKKVEIYHISGLSCGGCAMQLEHKLKKEKMIEEAQVDFINSKIKIFYNEKKFSASKKNKSEGEKNKTELKNENQKINYNKKNLSSIKKNKNDLEEQKNIFENENQKINEDEKNKNEFAKNENAQNEKIKNLENENEQKNDNEKIFAIVKKTTSDFDSSLVVSKNENEKLKNKKKINYKILLSIVLSLILISISYLIPMSSNVKIIFLIAAYLVAGYDILIKLFKNLFKLELFDENFLMGVATIAAFAIGEHLEAIAVMIFYKLGEFFEDMAVSQSRESISNLMDIKPEFANLETKKGYEIVDPKEIKIDDIILVKPGEKIPLDGTIIEGTSLVDNKALTGESKNIRVKKGSEVLSGSINKDSIIKIKVNKEYNDSTVAKILDLVENSSSHKAPTENFITKFARVYTPIVVLLALLVAIIPPLTFSTEGFNTWIYRAVVFLVISCPCALVISIPLGYFAGVGNASRNGILVKGSNYLEALNNVESVVMDKTGTLTYGDFKVTKVVPYNKDSKKSKNDLLKLAAYAEQFSNHPIAVSIKESYQKEVDTKVIKDYQEIAGQGIKVKVKKDTILAGNYTIMSQHKVKDVDQVENSTVVYLAKNGQYQGHIIVEDEVKKDSIQGLQELRDLGVKDLIMLSGDSEVVAKESAQKVGITQYFAQLLPNDKVKKFEEIDKEKGANKKIAFVGDGINDAPVLSRADIGIAMGGVGSDAAIESADIVIMNDEISKIPLAMRIARKTQRIVKQNIALAMGIKLLAMLLGVLGIATIWQAVIADVGVAILAILNSMRVLNNKN